MINVNDRLNAHHNDLDFRWFLFFIAVDLLEVRQPKQKNVRRKMDRKTIEAIMAPSLNAPEAQLLE